MVVVLCIFSQPVPQFSEYVKQRSINIFMIGYITLFVCYVFLLTSFMSDCCMTEFVDL